MASMAIDLNADLGESFGTWTLGDDLAMLDVVTSANIACGFHAGDPLVMMETVRAAAQRQVRIGAHVGYRDLVGFGRRNLDVEPATLCADIIYQVGALQALCAARQMAVTYLKPHGALYNRIAHDAQQAAAVVTACEQLGGLPLLAAPGSVALELAARQGITVYREAFADRAYRADGTLVPRDQPGSVLTETNQIAQRAVAMALGQPITTDDQTTLVLKPDSICLHGDTPGAVQHARAVRAALCEAGAIVQAAE